MSKDIVVLAPNGRRQVVKCTPNTTILQILEDVCNKQGFPPGDYDLKHHSKILDLSNTIRFSNLPNKAYLEMVEAERKREDSDVTIGLQLESGERRTGDFPPQVSLYDVLTALAPTEIKAFQYPTIIFMRREVHGEQSLRNTTLRQLGLTGGRAALHLLNKSPEELKSQANVSSVLPPRPVQEQIPTPQTSKAVDDSTTHPLLEDTQKKKNESDLNDPIKLIKQEMKAKNEVMDVDAKQDDGNSASSQEIVSQQPKMVGKNERMNTAQLERRLNIEKEVTFLGPQKAVLFAQPESVDDDLEDLPDDFYELSLDEVRTLYHELQQQRSALENAPLATSQYRASESDRTTSQKRTHKHVVVRIQFPARMVLQGVFAPTDTIEDIRKFIIRYLKTPERPFEIFTTPFKEVLDPKTTLIEAKFVPCVHMHFKWIDDDSSVWSCLKDEVCRKMTSVDAAALLASKFRAPTRRKAETLTPEQSRPAAEAEASTSKDSKIPKWLRI